MTLTTAFLVFLCGLLATTSMAISATGPTCAVVLCPQGTKCIETPSGPQCVPIDSCVCPEIFDPVCCKTPTGLKTTSNSCFCTCEPKNMVISSEPCLTCANVQCKKGFRCVETSFGPRCEPITDCQCTFEFDPVCCKLADGTTVTKSNPCQCTACNQGATIISKGPCRLPRPPSCICPDVFDPVCCQVKSLPKFTASNSCECGCRKGRVVSKGECE